MRGTKPNEEKQQFNMRDLPSTMSLGRQGLHESEKHKTNDTFTIFTSTQGKATEKMVAVISSDKICQNLNKHADAAVC